MNESNNSEGEVKRKPELQNFRVVDDARCAPLCVVEMLWRFMKRKPETKVGFIMLLLLCEEGNFSSHRTANRCRCHPHKRSF